MIDSVKEYVVLKFRHLAPCNVSEFWFNPLIGHVTSSFMGVNQIKKILHRVIQKKLQRVNQIKKYYGE
jgi:hypothetical protein